ncbi:MAG: calcium-binding protein [Nannocystales bacterium]
MAWRQLYTPVLALLPALALGGCDSEDPVVEDGIESSDESDADAPDEEGQDEEGQDDDAQDPEGQDDDTQDPEDDGEDDDSDAPPPPPKPAAAVPCDEDQAWEGYECETQEGEPGSQQCIILDDEEFWTPCTTEEAECVPGDGYDQGCLGELCTWNGEGFERHSWEDDDCITPLVLNFDRGPVEFAPVAAATFDLSTDGTCTNTAWPTSPWLALDRDGDGMIKSGAELFGNATQMSSGGFAQHGFAALSELDSNLDGKIDAQDERFSELVLWNDLDDDRIGAYAELRPLTESTVVSIDLGFSRRANCDAMGNCGFERAAFEYQQAGSTEFGEVVDVRLLCQ